MLTAKPYLFFFIPDITGNVINLVEHLPDKTGMTLLCPPVVNAETYFVSVLVFLFCRSAVPFFIFIFYVQLS